MKKKHIYNMSVLLRRLESLGLYFKPKIHPSLGRRSSAFMRSGLGFRVETVAVLMTVTGVASLLFNNGGVVYAAASTISIRVSDSVSLDLSNYNDGFMMGSTSASDTTIGISTNNATGYTLKIAAASGTTGTPVPLTNVDTNCTANCTIPSITTSTLSDVNDFVASTWGYLPSKFNSGANTVFRPAPTIEGDTLDVTNAANNSENDYNIVIGAKVSYATTPPGTYSSAFVVTAVANATPYTITYNVGDGSNAPVNESSSSYAETVNISSAVPTKTNYTFLGWCSGTSSVSNITTTAGVDSCGGITYNPNGVGTDLSWNIDQTSNTNNLYLYAMWGLNSYTVTVNFAGIGVGSVAFENSTYGNAASVTTSGGTTSLKYGVPYTIAMEPTSSSYALDTWATTANGALGSTTDNPTTYTVTGTSTLTVTGKTGKIYMQDLTLANCPTTITTVYDKRDETPYRVQKLADDKCWMLDNLALDLTALTQTQLYGTGDNAGKMTNASNEALGYLKGATTGTATDKWAMAAVKKTWTSSYSYSQPWIAVDSTTSGGCNNAYCVDGGAAGSPWSYDSETSETINGVTSIAQGKIGVYYNYCAASAGSYCWGSTGTSSSGSPSSDPVPDSIRDITDDICPYGWRLPTGGSTGEFQNLYDQYANGSPNQVTAFQTVLSTPLSGYFYSGKARYQGNYGFFWSSTWLSTSNMCRLYVLSSDVYPSYSVNRSYGNSVRCILAE